jgi:hypothetical protein
MALRPAQLLPNLRLQSRPLPCFQPVESRLRLCIALRRLCAFAVSRLRKALPVFPFRCACRYECIRLADQVGQQLRPPCSPLPRQPASLPTYTSTPRLNLPACARRPARSLQKYLRVSQK